MCGIIAIAGVITGALIVMFCDGKIVMQRKVKKAVKLEEKNEDERKLEANLLQQMHNLLSYDGGVKPKCDK